MRPHVSGTERVGFSKQEARGNLVVASPPVSFLLSELCGRHLLWTSIGLNMIHTFFSHKILQLTLSCVSQLVLIEVSAPTRLGLRGSNVRRKFRKRTTSLSKSSTLKGLLYAPIQQKQYHKRTTLRRLKILLRSIVARKVRTIALEQSAKKAVMRHAINAIWHG
jgi:hypothetical protein